VCDVDGSRADGRARRHCVAQDSEAGEEPGRRVLQHVPRPDGVGVYHVQNRIRRSRLPGQYIRERVEGLPGRSAAQTWRQLRRDGMSKRLGIGIVGSGFNAKFHMLGFVGVRDADILGVWSPNQKNAAATAGYAKKLGVGDAKPYPSIAAMVEDPAIGAIWLCGPNQARIDNVEEMVSAMDRGKGSLLGVACEKPLARNVSEAKRVLDLVNRVGLPHGYLENQV